MINGLISLYAINDVTITPNYLENRFWEINKQHLNGYFKQIDLPFFRCGKEDDIYFLVVDKMPDGSLPNEEYDYEDEYGALETRGGVYPFISFWLTKDIMKDDAYTKFCINEIFNELKTTEERNTIYLDSLKTEFIKNRVYYYLQLKKADDKIAEMVLLILYIIAEKVKGILEFNEFYFWNERVNHIVLQAHSLIDKVVDYKEFFEIVKSIIERKD